MIWIQNDLFTLQIGPSIFIPLKILMHSGVIHTLRIRVALLSDPLVNLSELIEVAVDEGRDVLIRLRDGSKKQLKGVRVSDEGAGEGANTNAD